MHHSTCRTGNGQQTACNMQIDNMEQEAYDMHADMCDTETMQQTALQPANPGQLANALRTACDSYCNIATYSMQHCNVQRATCSVQQATSYST